MPPQSPKKHTLLIVISLTLLIIWPISAHTQTKRKKNKSPSRSVSAKQSSKRSSNRSTARRGQRRPVKAADDRMAPIPENYPIAPDRIEVIESGSASAPELARYLNPPLPRSQQRKESTSSDPNLLIKRKGLKIDESRALQIQHALKQRGFFTGEATGEYDQATVEAMRRFQTIEKIPVTGYPTAHALKRLGL